MQDITYEQAQQRGIDMSMIAVCRKLRNLAMLDRVTLDDSEHRSGLNKHLFDYIEYCGMEVLDFIKGYLSRLQPYMLERRKDQEPDRRFICVVDNLYRISVYIKVINTQFEEVIVSFHEDNKRGIAKTNDLIRMENTKYVPVFADSILSKITDRNQYVVKTILQRGLKALPLELSAVKCQDVFLVEKRAIDQQFVSYCNDYIRELYTSDLNLDFDRIEVFSVLQQISFTSYGNDTFSSISLLIDSLCVQHDMVSKSVADFALVTFSQNLRLTNEQREELVALLEQKFRVTSIRGIDLILDRVKSNLGLLYDREQVYRTTTGQ